MKNTAPWITNDTVHMGHWCLSNRRAFQCLWTVVFCCWQLPVIIARHGYELWLCWSLCVFCLWVGLCMCPIVTRGRVTKLVGSNVGDSNFVFIYWNSFLVRTARMLVRSRCAIAEHNGWRQFNLNGQSNACCGHLCSVMRQYLVSTMQVTIYVRHQITVFILSFVGLLCIMYSLC